MNTSPPQATPQAALLPPPDRQGRSRRACLSLFRVLGIVVAISLAALLLPAVIRWWQGRLAHSSTDAGFVEAHVINLPPETVSGRIVRVFADEGDRVDQGRVVAEIDATPDRDKVNLASAGLAESSVVLTEDDVEKGIDEARATVKAANADLLPALNDHARFTNL